MYVCMCVVIFIKYTSSPNKIICIEMYYFMNKNIKDLAFTIIMYFIFYIISIKLTYFFNEYM